MAELFPSRQTLVDRTSTANVMYVGTAECGTATSSDGWCVRKIELDADKNVTSIKYANGTYSMDNVWDDRTSLSYS